MRHFLVAFVSLFSLLSEAMNIWSIELIWEKSNALTYRVDVIIYTLDHTPVDQKIPIQWGDNTQGFVQYMFHQDLPGRLTKVVYRGTHTYAGSGLYTVSVLYENYPTSVSNITLSHQEPLYIEAKIFVTTMLTYINSPTFLLPPNESACINQTSTLDLKAIPGNDHDELKYFLQPCRSSSNQIASGYVFPSSSNGFQIDQNTGKVTFVPTMNGFWAYSVRVEKYWQGVLVGTIARTSLVQVVSCQPNQPQLDVFSDTCVIAGQNFSEQVRASLTGNDSVCLTVFSDVFSIGNPPQFLSLCDQHEVVSNFSWLPTCHEVRKDPYELTFQVKAFSDSGSWKMLSSFNGSSGPFTHSSSGLIGKTCGEGWDSTTYLWFGKDSTTPRFLLSPVLDLSNGDYVLVFDMLFSTHTGVPNTDCEGPDEPDEGVYVQCSVNGQNWVTLAYFNPAFPVDSPGHASYLIKWNNFSIPIPPTFLSSNVRVRWIQFECTDKDYDHWGIDNVRLLRVSPYKTIEETRFLEVIAPPVQNVTAQAQGHNVLVSWDPASCSNAIGYYVYRKIGPSSFNPAQCETGLPSYLGYVCIDTIYDISQTSYLDNNGGMELPAGNEYCYRIIYWFADGALSKASLEACAQIEPDVPLITHVSVTRTSVLDGKIQIKWIPPLKWDSTAFQPPYRYVLYRMVQDGNEIPISSIEGLNAGAFIDSNLNTTDKKYRYKIHFQSGNGTSNFVDVGISYPAWSVFLKPTSLNKAIFLSWETQVPWLIDYTVIYRKNNQTQQFDSIGQSLTNFFLDTGLLNNKTYCYVVETVGRYTMSGLPVPLRNFSQEVCLMPKDLEPPCPPTLEVKTLCSEIQNQITAYRNPNCNEEDWYGFVLYYKPTLLLDEWQPVDTFNVSNYYHQLQNTVAGCYQLTSIDSSGNESTFSPEICVDIDLCDLYSLPNIFTPNGDGWNDLFCPFPFDFVERIDLHIFNRWGKEVFKTQNPMILWDGKNMYTHQLSPEGVYFYVCDVYEKTLDGLRKRTLRGVIHLYR
ncbi:MAG: gliding motility-associated C-terminal domain-containing protein [Bacteroidales bacterium]|nr:gliding motility-associated C-terminal domain-containing protein [Bacteroidales bacterium]